MDKIDSMRTLRELLICRHLRGHENIVKLLQIIPQAAPGPLREITLVFEWMATDLSRFIRLVVAGVPLGMLLGALLGALVGALLGVLLGVLLSASCGFAPTLSIDFV